MKSMETVSELAQTKDTVVQGPGFSATTPARLLKRLRPGSIAVIATPDFDPWLADRLGEAGVAAVINCAESITGRSPEVGVVRLLERGIPVLDAVSRELLEEVQQGETLRIEGNRVELHGGLCFEGVRLTEEVASSRLQGAREYMSHALCKLAASVSVSITQEWIQFFSSARVPALEPLLRDRPVAVITEGARALEELRLLRRRLAGATLIAVEGGYEVARRAGLAPQVVVGREAQVPQAALLSGSEIVLLVEPGGAATTPQSWQAFGVEAHVLQRPGAAEEAAMAIAADCGARIVLLVGSGLSFIDLARRGERGATGALLTRLRLGSRVMDGATYLHLRPPFLVAPWVYWLLGIVALVLLWAVLRLVLG